MGEGCVDTENDGVQDMGAKGLGRMVSTLGSLLTLQEQSESKEQERRG